MFVLKGLLIFVFAIASANCNNTIPTTTIGLKNENGNHTNKMGVVALSNAASDTRITIPTNASNVSPINDSKIITIGKIIPSGSRKAILIINSESFLRQSNRKGKGKGRGRNKKTTDPSMAKVESLLYEEYNNDGEKLVEIMMYTMEDVSKFFASFLHTEICHGRCPPRPEDEAKKNEATTKP